MAHRARKRFGQNFLHDQGIIHALVSAIGPRASDTLIEIGPGRGALTKALLPKVQKIIGIELDRDLIPILEKECARMGSLSIIQQDVLTVDFEKLANNLPPLRLVGNLPYNISTPLLFHLLPLVNKISDMHFMLQKEVVERLAAQPNDSAYGQLTVLIQYHCQVEHLLTIPPTAFSPAPKVDSAFVRLTPRKTKLLTADNYESFQYLVKKCFTHPRKTLRNNLKNVLNNEQISGLNINLNLRPQELSIADYVALSNRCGNIALPKEPQNDESHESFSKK